jgi:hypothetical protein
MKKNKKYQEDLIDVACAGIIIGIGLTLFALKSFVDSREKKVKEVPV